jgi:hypothetical protein
MCSGGCLLGIAWISSSALPFSIIEPRQPALSLPAWVQGMWTSNVVAARGAPTVSAGGLIAAGTSFRVRIPVDSQIGLVGGEWRTQLLSA